MNELDYTQITDVQVENIASGDYPDFVDAYIGAATYKGRDMTEQELELLNEDGEFIYNKVIENIF